MGSLKNYIKFNFNYLISSTWKFNLIILVMHTLLSAILNHEKSLGVAYIFSTGIFVYNSLYSIFIIMYEFTGSSNYIVLRRKFYVSNIIVNLIIAFIASIIQSGICFMETQQIYYTINFFIAVLAIYSLFIIINTVVSVATITLGFRIMVAYGLTLIGLYYSGTIFTDKLIEVLFNKSVLPVYTLIILLVLIPIVFFIGYTISEKMEVYKSR